MKLKIPLIASMGALLLVGALFLSLVLSTAAYRPERSDIALPASGTVPPRTDEIAGRNLQTVAQTEITAENIQNVIASLSRPAAYTAAITGYLYYGTQTGEIRCRQSVKQGAYRVDYLNGTSSERTELIWDGKLYAWRSGAATYYEGTQGAFTTDQVSMLPTYESVCALPAEQITGGALVQEGDGLLLTVDTRIDDRVGVYKISVQTGLLRGASFSQGGKMTRAIEVVAEMDAPEDSLFVLPGHVQPVFG